MQDYIRAYGSGVIERLEELGAVVPETAVETLPTGQYAVYALDISDTGYDEVIQMANDFCIDHYPNNFNQISPNTVQLYFPQEMSRSLKNMSVDLAVIFERVKEGNPRLIFRILGARAYFEDGAEFQSARLLDVLDILSEEDEVDRAIGEVGED